MGLYDDAILDLRPTTKLVNDNTQAWYKISTLHYAQGEIERSLETIRECLKLDQVHRWLKIRDKLFNHKSEIRDFWKDPYLNKLDENNYKNNVFW